jgi:hypothetical protein
MMTPAWIRFFGPFSLVLRNESGKRNLDPEVLISLPLRKYRFSIVNGTELVASLCGIEF